MTGVAGPGGPTIDAPPPLRPQRRVTGMSAVLLPFDANGSIAWDAFAAGIARTAEAGLVPAVNMDTSYGPNLDPATRRRVLAITAEAVGDREPVPGWRFVGGAHVDGGAAGATVTGGRPGLDLAGYKAACAEVAEAGGVPGAVDRVLGFELGVQFHPHGRIWTLETYGEVLQIPQVVGAKHSSLRRAPEWARLALRDARRPDFLVLTGNDLAIDMVRWGSDYLLGLSAFAPAAFARRDRLWAAGDRRALEVDAALQALGALAFRDPVPAYRHDAALVWHRRGWAPSAQVHPASPTRPPGEAELLATLLDRLDAVVAETESGPA
jgi:dihydrodipicolinate synthase/N-acetylneuraminate lyase